VTRDALGRELRLPARPQRIVSLVPSLTELLADLGLDEEVVGLTTFCVHPAGWRDSKVRIGGTKGVRIDAVRALDPDLIVANKEENTSDDVAALSAIAPVYVTDIGNIEEALAAIESLGALVDREANARALSAEIRAGFDSLTASRSIRTAYLIWRDPYMTVGGDTFIHDVMKRGHWENVFANRERYPKVSVDELRDARPEVVLLSSEPFPFKEIHRAEVQRAIPDAKVLFACGEAFSWYGSRLRETPSVLADCRSRVLALAKSAPGVDSIQGELR
jgi:ABC-type Fe3+-hydroxamate transport system substrate-binding protein